MFQRVLSPIVDGESGTMSHQAALLSIPIVSWVVWRLWKFTLLPALYPDEPKAYPYLIPCIQVHPFERSYLYLMSY